MGWRAAACAPAEECCCCLPGVVGSRVSVIVAHCRPEKRCLSHLRFPKARACDCARLRIRKCAWRESASFRAPSGLGFGFGASLERRVARQPRLGVRMLQHAFRMHAIRARRTPLRRPTKNRLQFQLCLVVFLVLSYRLFSQAAPRRSRPAHCRAPPPTCSKTHMLREHRSKQHAPTRRHHVAHAGCHHRHRSRPNFPSLVQPIISSRRSRARRSSSGTSSSRISGR